jgi:hypothetical protein
MDELARKAGKDPVEDRNHRGLDDLVFQGRHPPVDAWKPAALSRGTQSGGGKIQLG